MPTAASVAACELFLRDPLWSCWRVCICSKTHVLLLACFVSAFACSGVWAATDGSESPMVQSSSVVVFCCLCALRRARCAAAVSASTETCALPVPEADAGPGIWFSSAGPGPRAHQHSASPGLGRDPASNFRYTDFAAAFGALVCREGGCAQTSGWRMRPWAASHSCISCPAAASVTRGGSAGLIPARQRGGGGGFGRVWWGCVCTNSSCRCRNPTHERHTCVRGVCCESAGLPRRAPVLGGLGMCAEVALRKALGVCAHSIGSNYLTSGVYHLRTRHGLLSSLLLTPAA